MTLSRRTSERDDTTLDRVVDGLFAGMLLVMPLAFGATEAWSQQVWFGLVAAIGVCVLAGRLVDRERPFVFTWAYVPIVLFLLLAVSQLLPLPRGLMQTLSPGTVALRDELLADLAQPARTTLSLYGFATAQQLRLVLAASAIFAIVLHAYRSPERIRRLLLIVTFAGLAVAGVAAYQDLTQATLIYGSVPVGHKNAGPFQNYSHFSQFMNLSIGGAVALLAMTVAAWSENGRGKVEWAEEFRRPGNAIYFWPAATLIAVGPVLVLASMSRMGMISLLVAGAVTAGLVGWRGNRGRSGKHARGRPGGLFLVLTYGVCATALIAGVGFEVVYDRLATVTNVETTAGTRWQILKDLTAVYRQFPVFGTGLGTHEFVYPQFSRTNDVHLYAYAENEYAQLLEEAGSLGLLLAAAFLAVVGAALLRAIKLPKRAVQFAAFGLCFGLVAVLVHSFSDFGQHVPANAVLTATFCALLINIAAIATPSPVAAVPAAGRSPVWAGAALAAFVIGVGWLVYRADVARRAEAAFVDARVKAAELETAGWQGDDAAFIALLQSAGRAVELEPGSAAYGHWLNAYRWQTIARDAADPGTRELSVTEESVEYARGVVAGLDAVRQLCPTYGPPLSVAGQIRLLALGDPAGQTQVRLAYRLAPYSRAVCYAAGTLAARRGDWDLAAAALGHYLKLDGPRWHVVDTYLLANRPDLAFETAKADRWNLRRLADGLAASWPNEATRVAECRALVEQMLIAESDKPNARPTTLIERATIEQQKGHTEQAVMWYQKAVDTDYGRVDWRMALARAQAAMGQRDEAARNLRICLRLRPKWPEAESLLAEYASGRSGPIRGN